jgi:hypothetical protein|tara:strand:+ start:1582 stop:1887 length:306 start_codon:yes stop_codon:yes gene_type:complete
MEDLTQTTIFPHTYKFTASSNTTQINLPRIASHVAIGSEDKKIYFCFEGGSDGGALPSNHGFVPKENMLHIALGKGRNRTDSIYIASSSASCDITIILTEE